MPKDFPYPDQAPFSAEDIERFAVNGGLHTPWLRETLDPWELVAQKEGETHSFNGEQGVWEWYCEQKPLRVLAELKESDPARHAGLLGDKEKSEQLWHKLRALNQGENVPQDAIRRFFAENDDLVKGDEKFKQFVRESQEGYRIDDIYGDLQRDRHLFGYMHYALLRNKDDGDYLSVMIDARHNLHGSVSNQQKSAPNYVKIEPIKADGRHEAAVLEQAHWQWAEHLLYRNRYAPHYQENIVIALEEADRLRAKFNGATAEGYPAVRKEVFDFYPAFMRAYRGEEGFFQALIDVYGPKGNVRHCSDMGVAHNHWVHEMYNSGGETGRKYEVTASKFLRLYEQMGRTEKADFEKAFDRFVKDVLPTVIDDIADKGNKGFIIIKETAPAMARLKIAIEYGSGALQAADWFKTFEAVEHEMLDIAGREKTPVWSSRRDRPASQRAPRF